MVNLIDDPDCPKAGRHRKLEKAAVKKGEEAIQQILTAVRNQIHSPSRIKTVYSLASGAPVPMDVEMDMLRAEAVGKAAKAEFIRRLQSGESGSFFTAIKKKKLKTMEACNKKITIYSNQEETDTRVVLCLHHPAALRYKNAVVRTPDTDIVMILLYHTHAIKLTVYLDTG